MHNPKRPHHQRVLSLLNSLSAELREMRADMYRIRTFLEIDSQPVKFEIIRGARIPLAGTNIPNLPAPCLDHSTCVAEKFLANTDRGLDKSTRSRDLIDLTFMAGSWTDDKIAQGLKIAEAAYGASVSPLLKSTVDILDDNDYWKQFIRLLHTPVTITISTQRHARVKRETKNIRAASNTRLGNRLRRHVILRFLRTDG